VKTKECRKHASDEVSKSWHNHAILQRKNKEMREQNGHLLPHFMPGYMLKASNTARISPFVSMAHHTWLKPCSPGQRLISNNWLGWSKKA
jgi:hypothetical protein